MGNKCLSCLSHLEGKKTKYCSAACKQSSYRSKKLGNIPGYTSCRECIHAVKTSSKTLLCRHCSAKKREELTIRFQSTKEYIELWAKWKEKKGLDNWNDLFVAMTETLRAKGFNNGD